MTPQGKATILLIVAAVFTTFATLVIRCRRRRRFRKENLDSNTNLHQAGAQGNGEGGFKDQVYKDAIYDSEGKLDAVEIL